MSDFVSGTETLHHFLLEHLDCAVTLVAPSDGGIIDANTRAAKLFGCSVAALCNRSINDLRLTETLPASFHTSALQEPVVVETGIASADGTVTAVEATLCKVSRNNEPVTLVTWRKVTGYERVEGASAGTDTALQKVNNELNAIINALPGLVSVVDREFNVLVANDEVYRKFGQNSPQEVIGKKCHLTRKGLNHPCPQCGLVTAFETGETVVRVSTPDEEKLMGIATKAYAVPLKDSNGSVWGGVEVIVDVTDLRIADEKLAAEKELLSVTLRSIGDGVITTDTEGRIRMMNRAAEELTGWSQTEACGQPLPLVFNIINEQSRETAENPVEKVLKTRNVVELANHTLLITRDGRKRVLADSGAPIRDRNGVILGVVLVFRDETDKRKLQEHIQRTDKLNSIGVLAGGIAHDFNNLLGGIYGYIDLAKDSCGGKGETTQLLDGALATYARARDLTQQLLTFARGGAPVRKTGSLGKLLRENVQFALSGSTVTARFEIAEDLACCDFDANQIGQVIDNLVINAVQAMSCGGTITVIAENFESTEKTGGLLKPGMYIHLSFSDTGTGISRDILPRIFDPFFTTKQTGTGLGLATVYSIIKKHDGEITVESIENSGTRFDLYFPASSGVPEVTVEPHVITHRGTGKILLMDDEAYIRDMAGRMLTSMGYNIVEARNGTEALDLLKDAAKSGESFSAVIMDLTVPGGMGGKDAVRILRESDADIPVFVSSGYSEDPVMAKPDVYGFTASIPKPFLKEQLAGLLNRYCGSNRS
ncbi:MAG: PAS domain-containing protein [Chitinispirillaceae bacterium]|nr:PAS domain-containing protein [Chitinispirillaceae bacterium]